jgi:hypothetical protein
MPLSVKKFLPRDRLVVLILIVFGLALVAIFGLRVLKSFGRVHHGPPPPPIQAGFEDIRPWMTVAYVAKLYNVPVDYLMQAAGIPADVNPDSTSLMGLEHKLYPGRRAVLFEKIVAAIHQYQVEHGTPVVPPGAPGPTGLPPEPAP